jgi:NAD(P)-dependent dehydrogenase (short-subunit alcohol dehydrogenase family)
MAGVLEGRVAVVTGASGGLGEHFARVLSGAGARVAVAARRADKVQALAGELSARGARAMALQLDVTDAAAVAPALDRVEAELGPLSILVNNAGVSSEGPALELALEDWDNAFNVNVRGAFVSAQAAARLMIASGEAARGHARVVNIASVASHTVLPGLAAYCASKAALAMLTKCLAREWARPGISVNAICPGYIETDLNSDWFQSESGQKQIQRFPRRRLMTAADLDAVLLTLSGPQARAITGALITVDDGQSLIGGG